MPREIDASPPPSSHLATLARMGYSFNAAIADILDNSVSAGASLIDIRLVSFGDLYRLTILDNGSGMSSADLMGNMVIGCKDPGSEREVNDLGRFGAGLKTASFSQARVLTVFSWAEKSKIAGARWDTDLVKKRNKWCLLELSDGEVSEEMESLGMPDSASGTLVCWDGIHSLEDSEDRHALERVSAALVSDLQSYIALHFHRFISPKLTIKINGVALQPIDPFMSNVPGYIEGQQEVIRSKKGPITIKAHNLPRPSSLDAHLLALHGGAKKITEGQGIYLYRNKRLISGGGWHGVAARTELNNLARIQIDINSKMDEEWQTDVKKSRLSIPLKVKQVLKRISPVPIKRSRGAHKYAGKLEEASALWMVCTNEREGSESVSYIADLSNQKIADLLSVLESDQRTKLIKYLTDLSAELPVKHIYHAVGSNPRSVQREEDVDREIAALLGDVDG